MIRPIDRKQPATPSGIPPRKPEGELKKMALEVSRIGLPKVSQPFASGAEARALKALKKRDLAVEQEPASRADKKSERSFGRSRSR